MIKWKSLLAAVLIVSCGVLCAEDFLEVVKHAEAHIKLQYDKESYAYKIAYDKIGKIYAMQVDEKQKIALIKEAFPKAFEEKPLIYLQPISWHIHSLALGYDIQESATSTRKVQDITKEIANIKSARNSSQQDTVRTNRNLTGGVSAGNDFSLNPFSWLSSLLNTKIKLSGSYAYGRNSSTQTAELWSKAQQNMFSQERTLITEIIQQTNVKNFHLSFSVTLTNNSFDSVVCDLSNAEIPILISGKSFNKYAKPVQKTNALRIMPQNSQIVSFRMELDNTTVRELVSYMSHSSPEIHFEQGNFPIYTNNGQVNIAIYPLTYPVKLNLPGFSGTWNIRRNHTNSGNLTTIWESLQEISKDFEKTIGKTDIFTWQSGELTQVSGVAFGNFSDKDKAFRYIAFLQSGNNVYDQVDETLLKEKLPMGGYTIWVIDLNNLENYKNIHPDMQKLIYEKISQAASDGFLGFEKGNPAAQYRLARMYRDGYYVKKDIKEVVKWLRKSAEQGNPIGQAVLGVCYMEGIGVEKDVSEAVKWLRKSVEQGNPIGQATLGACYMEGIGVEKDVSEAVKWLRKAAEQGDAVAQCGLGVCYLFGVGVKKDASEAVKWYRKAAEQGNAEAQYELGECYLLGVGVKKDASEAVKWCRKAAEQDHPNGQYMLGMCYKEGLVVKKNREKAIYWLRKSAEQGDEDAKKALEALK